jgi:hypothetical protein
MPEERHAIAIHARHIAVRAQNIDHLLNGQIRHAKTRQALQGRPRTEDRQRLRRTIGLDISRVASPGAEQQRNAIVVAQHRATRSRSRFATLRAPQGLCLLRTRGAECEGRIAG